MRRLKCLLTAIFAVFITGSIAYSQSGIYVRPGGSSLPAPVTNQTWLFNSITGQIYVWNGSAFSQISPPQSNLTASVNPTVVNDNTQGYALGSLWLNTNNGNLYICTNPATGAAVWVLLSSNTINASLIPQLLFTALSTGDFFPTSVIPAIPGSGLVVTLPAATGYVGGSMVSTTGGTFTYANNSWTYDFVAPNGIITHYAQSPSTLPPSVPGSLLLYNVESSGGNVTSILPYFALPATLRQFMISPPNSAGYVLQSDPTNPLGQSYQILSPFFLSTSGATTGNTLQFTGSNLAYQTLTPNGGGTGSATVPTDGQIPIGSTSGTVYAPANVTPGADIAVVNGSNSLTLRVGTTATPGVVANAGAGSGATATVAGGHDFAGVVTLTTGTGPTTTTIQMTLTQSASFGSGPVSVILYPANAAAGALTGATQVIANPTSTGFTITSGSSALSASTAYAWNYLLHN